LSGRNLNRPSIIVGDSERSKYVSEKLSLSCLFDDPDSVHIFTIQTTSQYDNIPHSDGNSVFGYFIVYLVSMALPRLFIPIFVYALYPLIRSISIGVTSCNRITSVSCLWRNSVGIGILIIPDMPLTFRVAILCVRH